MKNNWYQITHTENRAHVRIGDLVGFFGPTVDEFLSDLGDAQRVDLYVNSTGGSVLDGALIYETLRKRDTVATVARAWSTACFLTMAAREITILPSGSMMTHYAQAGVLGGPPELRQMADKLEGHSVAILEACCARTGQTAQTVKDWMASNRFFNAEEAVQHKLADRVFVPSRIASAGAASDVESSSASSAEAVVADGSEEICFGLLRDLGPIQTMDKAKFGRELDQWYRLNVKQM